MPTVPDISYRQQLYKSYTSDHYSHVRDITSASLRAQFVTYEHRLSKLLPPDRHCRILELGCGYGALLAYLADRGYDNAEGSDANEEQVAKARSLGFQRVRCEDVFKTLARPVVPYDCVIAIDLFEHLTKPEVMALLDAVSEALRPGGLLILQVPNAASPFGGRQRYGDFTHELSFTMSSLGQILRGAGLTDVRLFGTPPVIHGFNSFVRFIFGNSSSLRFHLLRSQRQATRAAYFHSKSDCMCGEGRPVAALRTFIAG